MNYLAHAWLSPSPGTLVGNLLADRIHPRDQKDLPQEIRGGIQLHHAIDQYTDQHPEMLRAREVFRPKVRLYAGACVDVAMDYFLALELDKKKPQEFEAFCQNTGSALGQWQRFLPLYLHPLCERIQQQNWFPGYATRQGIHNAYANLVRRSSRLSDQDALVQILFDHETLLHHHFDNFFPDLENFVKRHSLWQKQNAT